MAMTSIKHYLRKDLVWAIVLAILWFLSGAGSINPISFIYWILFLTALLAVWWHEQTADKTGKTVRFTPKLIGFIRWIFLYGLLYTLGQLAYGLYYSLPSTINTEPRLAMVLLLSIAMQMLVYKMMADWSYSLQTTNRVSLKEYRGLIITIIVFALVGYFIMDVAATSILSSHEMGSAAINNGTTAVSSISNRGNSG